MRKYTSIFLASLLLLAGCAKEYNPVESQGSSTFDFTLEAELGDFIEADQTKASATTVVRLSWSKGDEISVVNLTTGKALGGTLVADATGNITTFSGTLTGTVNSGDKVAFLYPSQGYTQEQDYEPVTIDFSHQIGQSKEDVPVCVCAVVSASGNNFSKSTATFRFLMSYLQFSFSTLGPNELIKEVRVENIGSSMSLSLSADGFTATPNVGTITMAPSSYSTSSKGTKSFYMTFAASPKVDSRRIDVWTERGCKAGSFSGSKLNENMSYTATVADFEEVPNSMYDYVDLGLPSGTKWATRNVGAAKPEDYGDFFLFGDVDIFYEAGYAYENPQTHWKPGKEGGYGDSSSRCYANDSSGYGYTKYMPFSSAKKLGYHGFYDNKLVLDLEDDAAYVNCGPDWRTPTDNEWRELINNCTKTWVTLRGVSGYKLQSNVDGYTDKWIFIPAGGVLSGVNLGEVGIRGYYLSSKLWEDAAWDAYDVTLDASRIGLSGYNRALGKSLRPVYFEDKSCGVTGISIDRSSANLTVEDQISLVATVSANDGALNKDVHWTSSDPSIATVNYDGSVVAVGAGSATITARTVFGGFSASCAVDVQRKPAVQSLTTSGTVYGYIPMNGNRLIAEKMSVKASFQVTPESRAADVAKALQEGRAHIVYTPLGSTASPAESIYSATVSNRTVTVVAVLPTRSRDLSISLAFEEDGDEVVSNSTNVTVGEFSPKYAIYSASNYNMSYDYSVKKLWAEAPSKVIWYDRCHLRVNSPWATNSYFYINEVAGMFGLSEETLTPTYKVTYTEVSPGGESAKALVYTSGVKDFTTDSVEMKDWATARKNIGEKVIAEGQFILEAPAGNKVEVLTRTNSYEIIKRQIDVRVEPYTVVWNYKNVDALSSAHTSAAYLDKPIDKDFDEYLGEMRVEIHDPLALKGMNIANITKWGPVKTTVNGAYVSGFVFEIDAVASIMVQLAKVSLKNYKAFFGTSDQTKSIVSRYEVSSMEDPIIDTDVNLIWDVTFTAKDKDAYVNMPAIGPFIYQSGDIVTNIDFSLTRDAMFSKVVKLDIDKATWWSLLSENIPSYQYQAYRLSSGASSSTTITNTASSTPTGSHMQILGESSSKATILESDIQNMTDNFGFSTAYTSWYGVKYTWQTNSSLAGNGLIPSN